MLTIAVITLHVRSSKVIFPQRIEAKTAQEFLSMVEDSDILFHSVLGCASLLLIQIYLAHMPKLKMWSMCYYDCVVVKELFLPEKE